MKNDHIELSKWLGKTEVICDVISQAPYAALSATLDRQGKLAEPGLSLPPLWHWLYFLPKHLQSEIGLDGHAKLGSFLPPVTLPRRMWAGGRFKFNAPVCIGDAVSRTSEIESITEKIGRTGSLIFVTVRHDIRISGSTEIALSEWHDIVYRDALKVNDTPTIPLAAPLSSAWERKWIPSEVLLFRYSALTFNGHRIHYDRSYVTQIEGYPGLIVHGPLIATLLVDLLRWNYPDAELISFEFKAIRPTFDLHHFFVCGEPLKDGKTIHLWAKDHEGYLTMDAIAEIK
ncbi:FAS1-like dehydratase domain-containing protein [Undibacterium jejuense]|uniref:FAS1-like dehydratase domain-containing protein n=1 Tax=Undibacterium jejuense TaxID=1344949 RepID=UPI001C9AB3CB|nr:MaoC family dehydratase N-terminal domain-containing protein [Undibacterium jejuense]